MDPTQEPTQQSDAPVVPPPASHRNLKPWIVAGIVVVALFLVGLGPKVSQNRKLRQATQELANTPPEVTVTKLARSPNAADVTLPSNIQAIEQTTINARTSGYVAERFVDIGYKVTKGELLAIVESPELDQQVSQSAAEATKAQAGLGTALADSASELAAISAASAEESKAKAALSQANADLAHLRAKDAQAKAAVSVAQARETQLEKEHAAAVADLARAHSQLTLASKTYTRWKELEKAEAVAGQDVDEKLAGYESAQAVVESADAKVSSTLAAVDAAKNDVTEALNEVQAADADVQSGLGNVRAAASAVDSSKANVVAVRAAYRASRSNIESAAATISSDQATVRRYTALQNFERIVAPFSGVITARNVDAGDLVNSTPGGVIGYDQSNAVPRTGLFGLAKTDVLRAQIQVPEDSATLMHVNQPCTISVEEYPNRVFTGTVFNVSGALDAVTRTLLVEVRIPNADGALKPGMYSRITFLHTKGPERLWILANALIFNASGTRVATVTAENTLHYVQVRVGRDLGDKIEVLTGLRGDEQVITNPDDSLPEGAKVTIAPEVN